MSLRLITPVILCGGAGSRLWPLSRENLPKQFVSLTGGSSTFQQVLKRVSSPLFAAPIIVTNSDFRFLIAEQLRALGQEATILLEPIGRDSAPAVAAAAEFACTTDSSSLLLVLAADHIIPDVEIFWQSCREAAPVADAGRIVTFGIKPANPATNYGYIRPGPLLEGAKVHEVAAFVEKPDRATAERYVGEGYLWNSGNFLFRADIMLEELRRFEPSIKKSVKEAVEQRTPDLDFVRLEAEAFRRADKKSIDYAVMERTSLLAVLPVDHRWSDVGNWNAIWQISPHDSAGNSSWGPVELSDTHDSLIRADERVLTAVLGLDHVIVISTPDAVLVANQSHAEKVKDLVSVLKEKGRREASEHQRVYRPWGYYQTADAGTRYQVKRISVKPGARLSLQKHFHRSEHWVVVRGTAEVTIESETRILHENESTYIPISAIHRLSNPGKIELELIEVQVGTYLGEDDIIRLEDVTAGNRTEPYRRSFAALFGRARFRDGGRCKALRHRWVMLAIVLDFLRI